MNPTHQLTELQGDLIDGINRIADCLARSKAKATVEYLIVTI